MLNITNVIATKGKDFARTVLYDHDGRTDTVEVTARDHPNAVKATGTAEI